MVENSAFPLDVSCMEFGPFAIYPRERLLTMNGQPLEIGGRSLDILLVLMERPGTVVPKKELLERVWSDVVVEDGSLRFHMAALRKILRDGQDGARYISTQVGVGYAFVSPIHMRTPHPPPSKMEGARPHDEGPLIGQLPPLISHMVGREDDLRSLVDKLEEPVLLTIVGAAGMGKTTLACAVGHMVSGRSERSVTFVDLSMLEDGRLVASAIANALRITVQAEEAAAVMLGHLQEQELLLILDNCEHIIGSVAEIAELIRTSAPGVRLLATSREPLRASNEQVHWLGPLKYPVGSDQLNSEDFLLFPAVQLFLDRAKSADSNLRYDASDLRQIAEICERLEGMALPIELVAARAATHGIPATSALIGERFSLSWSGRRTAVSRHQTLRSALGWSYELLTIPEKQTLERLSVFLGAFSLEAALAVVADEEMDAVVAAAALDSLIEKSLVSVNRSGGVNVNRLPEMTRAYAKEKLIENGADVASAIHLCHARYYLDLLEDMRATDGSLSIGLHRMVGQIGNIRAGLESCFSGSRNIALGTRLAAASAAAFLNMSLLGECKEWCTKALDVLPVEQRGTHIELELQAALGLSLMFTKGNTAAVEAALRRALEIAEQQKDLWRQLIILGRLHIFHERIGDYETAHEWARKALSTADAIGEPEAVCIASSMYGISEHLAGDQNSAREHLERAVSLALPSEHWRTIFYGFDHRNRSIIALCRVIWLQGMPARGDRLARKAVEEASALGHPTTKCIALVWALPIHIG
ncbi:transcriptional regulator, partial [Thioclava sp. BHET1]